MQRLDPEPTTLEYDLMVARRRADALAPGSPSWAAPMEGVDELERAFARLRGGVTSFTTSSPSPVGSAPVFRPRR